MLKIDYIERCASTHKHLVDGVRNKDVKAPFLLYTNEQFDGIGSRENHWLGERGNLYMSFCIDEKNISKDIPAPSICIYYAVIMQDILLSKGSKVWLKWPNDFYVEEKKIGGIMTSKVKDIYIVSMGINLLSSPQEFGTLDISISNHELVSLFCKELEKNISWKQVFSKFKIQFQNSRNKTFHLGDKTYSLGDAKLCEDGSIIINGEKVYNLR